MSSDEPREAAPPEAGEPLEEAEARAPGGDAPEAAAAAQASSDQPDLVQDRGQGQDPGEDLLQAFEEVKGKPCRVTELEVKGFHRTKPEVVSRELERVREAGSLEEIKDELLAVMEAFQELDVFSEISIDLEKPIEDTPEACRVAIFLEEKDIHFIKATTFVQSDEGGLDGHIGVRNFFGHAERLRLTGEWGTRSTAEYALEFLQPRIGGLPWSLDVRLFNNRRSRLIYSSFNEQLRGASVGLSSSGGTHRLAYEFGWQHLTDPTNLASDAVQEQLGHKLRSSITYNFLMNHIEPFGARPEHGWSVRWFSELGGIHPHYQVLKFTKHRADLEAAAPLLPWASLSMNLTAGLLVPLGEEFLSKTTSITDRFSLGGIGSLRGFEFRGCGPTAARRSLPSGIPQRRDTLGGDVLLSAKGAVNFDIPIPGMKTAGIYGQVFGNIGNTVLLTGIGRHVGDSLSRILTNYRSSIGIGLVWPLASWGSLEVNCVLPLTSEVNDYRKPGIEIGFGTRIFTGE